ncbi:MAG: hypothetical protein AAGG01_01250, partial [Planctomycetota bacterium]
HVALDINGLARPGAPVMYTLSAPAGSEIYLMLAPRRAWREFIPAEGLLHLSSQLQLVPLGVMDAGGTLTRPFLAATPGWALGYTSIELQAFARVNGQDRYSEPRTLQVTDVGY